MDIFNSTQTLYNKMLSINYLSDALFRLFLGNIIIFSSFYLFKVFYLKINEPLFPDENNESENSKILNFLEYSKDNRLMEIGIDKINEDKHLENKKITNIFDIKYSVKVRGNLNKYYEKYNKNN